MPSENQPRITHITFAEYWEQTPPELRPTEFFGQGVDRLPESLDDFKQLVGYGWENSCSGQKITMEFIDMIAASDDPDDIVRRLPYEVAESGPRLFRIYFILPVISD